MAEHLTDSPLAAEAVLAGVGDPEHGGTACFLGTTRRESESREVVAIEYEAHRAMAEEEIVRIVSEAGDRFGGTMAAIHRVGRVEVGEPSVIVAASTPHRPEAFAACRFLIDGIKARAPIWKRIHYVDGNAEWIDGISESARGTAHINHGQSAAWG